MKTDPIDRFVLITKKSPSGCTEWQASKTKGYGHYKFGGKYRAHQIAYLMFVGEIPSGLCVLHSCDNPSCVSPAHLRIGTQLENIAERQRKGRAARGEGNHATLTDNEVREIRATYQRNVRGKGMLALAIKYGVGPSTILAIVSRKTWRHVV